MKRVLYSLAFTFTPATMCLPFLTLCLLGRHVSPKQLRLLYRQQSQQNTILIPSLNTRDPVPLHEPRLITRLDGEDDIRMMTFLCIVWEQKELEVFFLFDFI